MVVFLGFGCVDDSFGFGWVSGCLAGVSGWRWRTGVGSGFRGVWWWFADCG